MKKTYEVIGSFAGKKKGDLIEAEEASVQASGILGITLKEASTAASAPETPVDAGSTDPVGKDPVGTKPPVSAPATAAPAQKPSVPTPPAKPAAPAGVAKPAVAPVTKPE